MTGRVRIGMKQVETNRMKSALSNQSGAVLLMLLVIVTLVGLLTGIAGSSWQTIVQRSKEEDLLWKGGQIRRAIGHYYDAVQKTGKALKKYPPELTDLLLDPRFLETTRHLRRSYPDPMTGADWDIIQAPGGGIMGVRSTSLKKPFKQDGFSDQDKDFVGKQTYLEWEFVYRPLEQTKKKIVPGIKAPAIYK